MTTPSGSAAYKKRDGVLAMADDHRSVSWTPKAATAGAGAASDSEGLTIRVSDITNLQQTPASNPKVMLKILVSPQADSGGGGGSPSQQQQYVFSFTSATNARAEADKIRDTLSGAIAAVKAAPAAAAATTATANGGAGAGSSATSMSMAGAATSSSSASTTPWMDDESLKKDVDLQQSLLRADPGLQRVFMESLRSKPDSVTSGQFVAQFWSSRVHLLRAHAIEKHQTRGAYNVLSTLKPRVEDNVTRLNISKEQIQLIFNQHPLVKRVYDENVPKLTEQQFWSRFFQSRLFKRLRGERVSESDPSDPVLDKYLRADEKTAADRAADSHTVPYFLDLEGNEENVSQRQGNRPNFDMRPAPVDKVPIIRTLNNMSEKIMANVAPIDRNDPSAGGTVESSGGGGGGDESTLQELQLRDLRGDETRDRLLLNVRDQSQFIGEVKDSETAEAAAAYGRQDPDAILRNLREDLEGIYPDRQSVRLGRIVEPEEEDEDDEDEDEDNEGKRAKLPGSRSSMAAATSQVLAAIRERKAQSESESSSSETLGLSTALYDRVALTHSTTTEFLRQFWSAFLSGSADRAPEIAALVESLSRARERIQTVADEADAERNVEIEKLKQHARDVMAASGGTAKGKSVRPNLAGVPGGAKVVQQVMGPTLAALTRATGEYQRVLSEQTQAAQGQQVGNDVS